MQHGRMVSTVGIKNRSLGVVVGFKRILGFLVDETNLNVLTDLGSTEHPTSTTFLAALPTSAVPS
jgi:hypothetical protein